VSQLYSRTSKQKELSSIIYIFNTIQLPDRNMIGKKVVLEMMLFNNLSNSFSFSCKVRFVEISFLNINAMSMKQCMDPEFIKA